MTSNVANDNGLNMHKIKAIAFDAFGTVVHIPGYRKPYRQLIDYLKSQGVSIQRADADRLMTKPIELPTVGPFFGFDIPAEVLACAEMDLQYDVNSTILYEDTLRTISRIQTQGIKVAICSNLAFPYGAPVMSLLPELDAYAWSYEAGAVKPDSQMYSYLCQLLNCSADEVLMIGDTIEADYWGARRFGMKSLHLSRKTESKMPHYLHSLDDLYI